MKRLLLTSASILTLFFLNAQNMVQQITFNELSNWNHSHLKGNNTVETYNDLWGYAANGHEYAIIGSLDSIYFIEVTDPKNPVVRSAFAGRYNHCLHREFKTYKHYCYAVADEGNSSLQIFDLQYLPDSVHKVYDQDSLSETTHNLWVDTASNRLYLCSNIKRNQTFCPMQVLSLANPEAPTHIGPSADFGAGDFYTVHDVHVRGDTAYCSCGGDGLFIYNFHNPMHGILITSLLPSEYPLSGYNHSNWITANGKTMIFTDETGGRPIKSYDISPILAPAAPNSDLNPLSLFGQDMQYGSTAHNPYIVGNNLVYMSYYQDGVLLYDISNPANPQKIAQFDTYLRKDSIADTAQRYHGFMGCWGLYPFLPSGNIIALDMAFGLYVIRLDTQIVNGIEANKNGILPAINVYPNPAHDVLHIAVSTEKTADYNFELADIKGDILWVGNKTIPAGKSSFDIPLAKDKFTAGTYFLKTQQGGYFETAKVEVE